MQAIDLVCRNVVAARDDVVGSAAGNAAWLVGGLDAWQRRLQQRLQRRAVRVLGGVARLEVTGDALEVVGEIH